MSEITRGVLRMPPALWGDDPLSVAQRHARYVEAADTIDRLQAECDALRADAERYRWLRGCARATSEHWGGRWSLVIEGPAPGGNAPPASIDAAIDAAKEAWK